MFREGEYEGKGQNKPRGSDSTPSGAWSTRNLVRMGMEARQTFQDAVFLRQVHRYVDEKADLPPARKEDYRRDAVRFLDVMRSMADCTWSLDDYSWLKRRNRTSLQQTPRGREELRKFDEALC